MACKALMCSLGLLRTGAVRVATGTGHAMLRPAQRLSVWAGLSVGNQADLAPCSVLHMFRFAYCYAAICNTAKLGDRITLGWASGRPDGKIMVSASRPRTGLQQPGYFLPHVTPVHE